MAQTTQIVPTYPFPYTEVVINDYSQELPDEVPATEDTTIKEVYAFVSSKGIDNKFVKKTSKKSAVYTFGDSNFKLYGQPLMQAINVSDQDNSTVWMMRVMPENAEFANAVFYAYYKADTEADYDVAHKRKFRIRLRHKSFDDITTVKKMRAAAAIKPPVDPDGYTGIEWQAVYSEGRGTYGDLLSLRISQNIDFEKEYGIKMNNYEVLSSESGLSKIVTYYGGSVISNKYINDGVITMIDDVLLNTADGMKPLVIETNEDNILAMYDEYVAFVKQLHVDLVAEYDEEAAKPEPDVELLAKLETMIEASEDENIPDADGFDFIFGREVGSTEEQIGIKIVNELTPDVDTEAEDYDANDYFVGNPLIDDSDPENPVTYSTSDVVNFGTTYGVGMYFGSNGYFDDPRTEDPGDGSQPVKWTREDEINYCYKQAYSGSYDRIILSKKRMNVTTVFDAGYDKSVKEVMHDLCLTRNSGRFYFDVGILEEFSTATVKSLRFTYSYINDYKESIDVNSYKTIEYSTGKRVPVTVTYFLSRNFVNHVTNYGYHIPMVRDNCIIDDAIRGSIFPVIDDVDEDLKTLLYNYRFNYCEYKNEQEIYRGVQNTRQLDASDLLEENNVLSLYELKRLIEADVDGTLYNFTDTTVQSDFIEYEKAKYASWVGKQVQLFDIFFAQSKYEANHSIIHCYLDVTFRGLNKRGIVEIDVNRREYDDTTDYTKIES